jgi:WD40 repeat protein
LGHGQDVLDVRGSCDNSQLVSCGKDKLVVVWDVSSGSALRKYRGIKFVSAYRNNFMFLFYWVMVFMDLLHIFSFYNSKAELTKLQTFEQIVLSYFIVYDTPCRQ